VSGSTWCSPGSTSLPVTASSLIVAPAAALLGARTAQAESDPDRRSTMGANVVFVGWDRSIPGRERFATAVFQEFMGDLGSSKPEPSSRSRACSAILTAAT
jgi:hypothetical protein